MEVVEKKKDRHRTPRRFLVCTDEHHRWLEKRAKELGVTLKVFLHSLIEKARART